MSMTTAQLTDAANNGYLLNLFKRDIESRLVKIAIEAIRPAIEQAARDAVDSMQPRIAAQFDHFSNELVMHFSMREPKP